MTATQEAAWCADSSVVIEGLLFAAFGLLLIVFRKPVSESVFEWNRDVWHYPARLNDKDLAAVIAIIVGACFVFVGVALALGLFSGM